MPRGAHWRMQSARFGAQATAERIPTLLEVTDGQSHAVLIFWNAVSSPPRGSGELKPERGGRSHTEPLKDS